MPRYVMTVAISVYAEDEGVADMIIEQLGDDQEGPIGSVEILETREIDDDEEGEDGK